MRAIDLTGTNFGRWTVLEQGGHIGNRRAWKCVCECGKVSVIAANSLTCGSSKSCGCLASEQLVKRNASHGMSKTRLYRIWGGMLTRCRNQKSASYQDYGGRGIRVCTRWESFENFYADMAENYKPGLQIERINNDDEYAPGNCCWATRVKQCRNRRSNVFVDTPIGRITLVEAAKISGLKYQTIKSRMDRGVPSEKILEKGRMM